MTRKHLEAIARVVAGARASEDEQCQRFEASEKTRACIALGLADELAPLVPNFDRARFLRACGVQE